MLNPIWLDTFITLVDTGHFTKTAEKRFMTQPGVTQHINKLEQACGYSLIERSKKQFELTEQGRLVYQYAQAQKKNEQALIEQLSFDSPYAGQCTIACSGALALGLYPALLSLQQRHADLVIRLKAAPNQQIIQEIQTGKVDIGIVTDVPNPSLFDVTKLAQEELCLVLPATIDRVFELWDIAAVLSELGLINHPDAEHYLSLYFAKSAEQSLQSLNIATLAESGFINQISQILQPVAKGVGFTVLPKSAVDCFDDHNAIQVFKPPQPVIETLYLVKKKNRTLAARFDMVIDKIEQVVV
ncbi:LysR family transcriptional regulator [Catenovulum sp. SM1970]|uniref:LysR family transcriptional regulator n=1 Tax=Marinifaba aquimaris TaxID=2741323 RepID=UPI001573D990|nr:LysR family transcriptional regulator [Marinifaba aquimaris]NTS77996.1 LysR family transcriptional regulator [Marinifaba aquimaris]